MVRFSAVMQWVFVSVMLAACGDRLEKAELLIEGERILVDRLEQVELLIKDKRFRVEVARTDQQRQQGLMYRLRIGDREGMIFVFERDQRLWFWMENTYLPLSIAFLSKTGEILEIVDLQPLSTKLVRSKFLSRYALELPLGSYKAIGAREGDYVTLPEGFPERVASPRR